MLEPLGVPARDERVYRALLRQRAATVDELAAVADVQRRLTAAALDRLERLGLVHREGDLFTALAPDTAVERLIEYRAGELERVRLDARELVAEFHAGAVRHDPRGLVEIVVGEEDVLRQARAMERVTTTELLSFDKPPFLVESRPDHDEVGNERPMLSRGVSIRAIYTPDALSDGDRYTRVTELVEHGENARVLADLPLKMRVFDRRAALVPLTNDAGVTWSVAVVHRSALLDALVTLFDMLWDAALPLGTGAGERATLDVAVLNMLSAGITDAAIARRLGVSARTVRRRIQRLLDELHAATRFQAGAQAVRHGLL